ncbi:hypothetical protein SCOR_00335 [Sulfidibacter corallicola]
MAESALQIAERIDSGALAEDARDIIRGLEKDRLTTAVDAKATRQIASGNIGP